MQTIGLDTNAILTLRLRREPEYKKVEEIFEKCLEGKIKIYIPLPVMLEIEWVLRSFYKQSKDKIIQFFEELLQIENLSTDDKENAKFALNTYKESTQVSFTDCVIVRQIQSRNYDFITFDRNLEKLYHSLL